MHKQVLFILGVFASLQLLFGASPSYASGKKKPPQKSLAKKKEAKAQKAQINSSDEQTFNEVKQILEAWQTESEKARQALDTSLQQEESDNSDNEPGSLPTLTDENAEQKVDDFVNKATLDYMHSNEREEQQLPNDHIEKYRVCRGDGYNEKNQRYQEDMSDECVLPKLSIAARTFNIRYSFAKCIFEQENPERNRLAHGRNGKGLAQIVNKTMEEISDRWHEGDNLADALKQCLVLISNREQSERETIDSLKVPNRFRVSDIVEEAATKAPSNRLNPLYRDDSICMGLMTMAIKVQEAQAYKHGNARVSDHELARRYNGSWLKKRYAKEIVACVARQPKEEKALGGVFGFIKIPKLPKIPFINN